MKKMLLPLIGGLIIISTSGLSTGAAANYHSLQQRTEQEKVESFLAKSQTTTINSGLDETTVEKVKVESKSWNIKTIDSILNKALQYINGKLTINQSKLDVKKLPDILVKNIKLALDNLNNAVASELIKVTIVNDMVKLIYPKVETQSPDAPLINSLKSENNIIEFGTTKIELKLPPEVENTKGCIIQAASTASPSMWITVYGPSRWWRFWEFGSYVHFNDAFVTKIFAPTKTVLSIIDFIFLLKNLPELLNLKNILKNAQLAGNNTLIKQTLTNLRLLLGDGIVSFLGTVSSALSILSILLLFGYTWLAAENSFGPIIALIINIFVTAASWICESAVSANYGYGVKWKWSNFIFPSGFSSE